MIYNAEFDNRMLKQTCEFNDLKFFKIRAYCMQTLNSMFVGEWSSYYSRYKLQKLPNSTNDLKGDFIATLNLIRQMAKEEYKELPKKKIKLFGLPLFKI